MKTFILLIGLTSAVGLVKAADTTQAPAAPPLVTVTTDSTVPAPPPSAPVAAPAFSLRPVGIMKDVEKLTQAGTDPAVVKSYVQTWPTPYSVTANDILRLHDLGVPSDVLTAL